MRGTGFPNLIVLGGIVTILAVLINKWVFMGIVGLGGIALAVIIWKLVSRGLYVPPTILLDEARAKFKTTNNPDPGQEGSDGIDRNSSDEK